jgi:integrase
MNMKAVKVKVRERPKTNNQLALYLDYYPPIFNAEGKLTRRQSLGIYIHKNPTDKEQRKSNNEKRLIAEQIRAQQEKELLLMGAGLAKNENPKLETNFLELFKSVMQTKRVSKTSNYHWVFKHLKTFVGNELKCSEVTTEFCNAFSNFLVTGIKDGEKVLNLSINSAVAYLNIFRTILFYAYKNEYLKQDVRLRMEKVNNKSTKREYLTIEEVRMLERTDFKYELLKRACFFSIYSGLRYSDIRNLKWKNVRVKEGTIWLNIKLQKTGDYNNLPLHKKAVDIMGHPGNDDDFVFPKLRYDNYYNLLIRDWVKRAGINKHITFHCFRHSFATILLNNGVNIEVVSSLLGHKDITTTQIYAKIMGVSKEEALKKIKFD